MNASERHQRVKAILDTLRNAEGQLDSLKTLGQNGEPERALDLRDHLVAVLAQAIACAEAWDDYEVEKLS